MPDEPADRAPGGALSQPILALLYYNLVNNRLDCFASALHEPKKLLAARDTLV